MKTQAIADRILVRPIEVKATVRGISRPGAVRPMEGVVLLVGPGRITEFGHRIAPEIQEGDLVAFPDYAGKEIVDPRGFVPGRYLVVRQDEIQLNYGPATEWLSIEQEGQ